jgi:hypothetical protein
MSTNTLHSANALNTHLRAQPRLLMPAHRRDCPRQSLRPAMLKPQTQPSNDVFDGLKHAALIRFVQAVFDEPECRRVLDVVPRDEGVIAASPLQRLRAAAWSTCLYPSSARMQSDVIYAATLILGLQNLLKAAAEQRSDAGLLDSAQADVFFSICRSALYRLETQAPIHAALLRIALNWGNQDEMLDEQAQRMQSIVRQASRVCVGRLHLKRRLRAAVSQEMLHGQI